MSGIYKDILSIRPREIFKLVELGFPDQNVLVTLTMPPSAIGSLLTLESALLVALLKITGAKNIFEIGTYNGNTALLLANNTSEDAVITTLDLPPEDIELVDESRLNLADAEQNDQFLRQLYKSQGAFYVARAPRGIQSKIRFLKQNSLEFDPVLDGFAGTQEFIFIDGGHDRETVLNDSNKAFQMAKPDSVIVWHDYMSSIHTDVELCLREIAMGKKLVSIGSTMLCVCFQGRFASLLDV